MTNLKQIIWIFESKFTLDYVKSCLQKSDYEAYLDIETAELDRLINDLNPLLTIVHASHYDKIQYLLKKEKICLWDPENKYPEFPLRIASKINSDNITSLIESSIGKSTNE